MPRPRREHVVRPGNDRGQERPEHPADNRRLALYEAAIIPAESDSASAADGRHHGNVSGVSVSGVGRFPTGAKMGVVLRWIVVVMLAVVAGCGNNTGPARAWYEGEWVAPAAGTLVSHRLILSELDGHYSETEWMNAIGGRSVCGSRVTVATRGDSLFTTAVIGASVASPCGAVWFNHGYRRAGQTLEWRWNGTPVSLSRR